MARQRLIWTLGLTTSAMVLILPTLYFSGLSHASSEDWEVASTPVADVPLDALQRTRSVSLVFRVPANEQWTRIRDSWGDPGYVIVGRSPDRADSVLSWNSLGLQVTGTTGLGALDMAPAGSIQNSARSSDTGLAFRPKPGVRVRLDITVRPSVTLPAGELIVAPNWDSNGEGRAGGMAFALNVRPYLRLALLLGVALLGAAAILGNWRTDWSADADT
jgi:hypothetical protein